MEALHVIGDVATQLRLGSLVLAGISRSFSSRTRDSAHEQVFTDKCSQTSAGPVDLSGFYPVTVSPPVTVIRKLLKDLSFCSSLLFTAGVLPSAFDSFEPLSFKSVLVGQAFADLPSSTL